MYISYIGHLAKRGCYPILSYTRASAAQISRMCCPSGHARQNGMFSMYSGGVESGFQSN